MNHDGGWMGGSGMGGGMWLWTVIGVLVVVLLVVAINKLSSAVRHGLHRLLGKRFTPARCILKFNRIILAIAPSAVWRSN
jgi:uncharacterized membrane protein